MKIDHRMISSLAILCIGVLCCFGAAKADDQAGAKEASAAIECMETIPGWEWPVQIQGASYGRDEYLAKMQQTFVDTKKEMADNPFAKLGPQMLEEMANSLEDDDDPRAAATLKCLADNILTPAYSPKNGCNYSLIGVESWSAKSTDAEHAYLEGSTYIEMRLISAAPQPTAMVEGAIEIRDALNREIGRIKLDDDMRILPGKNWVQTGSYLPSALDRLTRLKPEHVEVRVCVRSVLYEDGTVRRFDE